MRDDLDANVAGSVWSYWWKKTDMNCWNPFPAYGRTNALLFYISCNHMIETRSMHFGCIMIEAIE